MGGKSVVGAGSTSKEEIKRKERVKDVHIGVFFEGSGLNMANEVFYDTSLKVFRGGKRELPDNVLSVEDITPGMLCDIEQEEGRSDGFTNVSMLFTLFNGEQFGTKAPYKKIYIEGAGTTEGSGIKYGVGGFAFGDGKTGVTALVSKAVRKVTEYVSSVSDAKPEETNLHFYVFGFSRGATCSRLFCHLLTRDKGSTLKCEGQFSEYGARTLVKTGRLEFLEEYKGNKKITVDFLGLYDTVASIGFLKRKDGSTATGALGVAGGLMAGGVGGVLMGGTGGALMGTAVGALAGGVAANVLPEWHYNNVEEYGLYIDQNVAKVKSVCHLCAMDEFRENFALVNLGKNVPGNAVEVMIPGCHSDVGGSYLDGTKTSSVRKGGIIQDKRKISFSPYNAAPTDTGYVSLSSFRELGWIGPKGTESTENYLEVELVRKIDRGYSDIPLAMMVKYCYAELGVDLFDQTPVFHDYSECKDAALKNFGNEMVAKMGQVTKGTRYWFFPTNYERLRLKHLHFSASYALGPVNAPGYNEADVMCRITYHGDKGEQKSAAEGVHFLYELSGTAITIEFGDNDDKNSTAGKTNPYVRKCYLMRSAGKSPKVSI